MRADAVEAERPGRSCPLAYRYLPSVLAREPELVADTVYVVGGLYGNPFALDAVLELAGAERGPTTLVFNGDFNWFNVDPPCFSAINEEVLRHRALRGNVETELAADSGETGCGCAYPDWVDEEDVDRSNTMMRRLRETAGAFPLLRERLTALPMHLVARVGDARIGVVHGDASSLSGWTYSERALAGEAALSRLCDDLETARLDVIASTHTCLPVTATVMTARGRAALFNNGAAGMPNFRGTRFGLVTRISVHPASDAIYGTRLRSVHLDAVPVHYDHARWAKAFIANWPQGTAGHASYFGRITNGPDYEIDAAMRGLTACAGALTGVDAGR